MTAIFIKLLNMSVAASYLVVAILLLRLILKKVPKAFVCFLWALVAVRLIFPISFESKFSMVPSAQVIPEDVMVSEVPYINTGMNVVNDYVNPVLSEIDEQTQLDVSKEKNSQQIVTPSMEYEENSNQSNVETKDSSKPANILAEILSVASCAWIFGVVVMIIYAVISYFNIYKKINEAVPFDYNIWLCDRVKSPFILGIIKPRIVLPSFMNEKEMEYVLAHEKAHLKRYDHLWKPLGFLLLTIYWFNPIMWVAYIFLCKDIEMACDEKVIKEKDATYKKAYTTTLLEYSISGRMITACPLAFGESGVKSRIKSVLNYKKPAFWVIIVSIIICTGVGVGFLTNPKSEKNTDINVKQDGDNQEENTDNEIDVEVLKKSLLEKGYYEYPDTEGMHGNTIIRKCRIPKEILEIMTTEQLAKAVIDYPMLMIYSTSSQSIGTDMLQSACDAYKELLTREDAKEILITQVKLHEVNVNSYVEIQYLKDIILSETKFMNTLTDEEKKYLNSYEPDAKLLGYYEYPDVSTVEQKIGIDMCEISKEVVENMTTEQLAQAVFDYPYIYCLAEALIYPNGEYYSKDMSDAYNEIVTREDAKYELLKKAIKYDDVISVGYRVQAIKDILLYDNRLNNDWSREEKEFLKNLQGNEKTTNGISFKTMLVDISFEYRDKFTNSAINSENIGESTGWIYPMHMFTTKKEFDDFYAEYKEIGGGLSSLHPEFNEIQSKYDENFFEENTLFIVYTYTGSYMIEEDVKSIYADDKQFSVYIDVTKNPECVDYGGGDYFILIEVNKEDIKGCSEFGAYRYPIEE